MRNMWRSCISLFVMGRLIAGLPAEMCGQLQLLGRAATDGNMMLMSTEWDTETTVRRQIKELFH